MEQESTDVEQQQLPTKQNSFLGLTIPYLKIKGVSGNIKIFQQLLLCFFGFFSELFYVSCIVWRVFTLYTYTSPMYVPP